MIWVDAHLSPALAKWITAEFGEAAQSVRDVGLRHAKDKDIFAAARQADAIVITKDEDFVEMVGRLGLRSPFDVQVLRPLPFWSFRPVVGTQAARSSLLGGKAIQEKPYTRVPLGRRSWRSETGPEERAKCGDTIVEPL